MFRRFPVFLIYFALVFYAVSSFGQSGTGAFSNQLKTALTSYYKSFPAEKVFVHTNQDVYNSGETIWYKIYTMVYGKPSALSTIIYLQLTDTAGNVIIQNKLPLLNGIAHGSLDINRQLKTGWYKLSAFTSWMMNFGTDGYFQQKIFIRNQGDTNAPANERPISRSVYHIAFYPEGGDLIEGNLSKVAFKAWGNDGSAAKIEGTVKDKAGNAIAELFTIHDGMGRFEIEALAEKSYVARVKFPDGSSQEIKLPTVQQSGISLKTFQDDALVQLKISYAGPAEKFENCTLAAFQNNGQVNTYPLKLAKGVNQFNIRKSDFSTGILRLTVFDNDQIPRAERIVFINKHDVQPLVIKPDTLSMSAGTRNVFSALIKDRNGNAINGNFSVAVTDAMALNEGPSQNIFSGLLLSPELKDNINNPGYYFKNNNDSLGRQLDLVMLTNGWRHFVWQKVLDGDKTVLKYPVEKSQYIAGKIDDYSIPAGKDKSQVTIMIMNQDSTKFIGYITPDRTGSFLLNNFNHSGISDVYLQLKDKKGHSSKLKSHLFPTLADSLRRAAGAPFTDTEIPAFNSYYLSLKKQQTDTPASGIMLKAVDVKSVKASPTEKLIKDRVSTLYQSDREYTLDLVNHPVPNIGLINYIKGRFPGLQVGEEGGGPTFIYRGINSLIKIKSVGPDSNSVPYTYLNEVRVFFSDVADIDLNDVALIRFIPPPAGFAPYNGGNIGALMIYTKRQADEVLKAESAIYDHFIFNGYSITREFGLDYGKPGASKSTGNNTTLFWAHDAVTDSKGFLKFRFNNSAYAQKFRIVVQGMDVQGRLVYAEQVF